MAVPGLEPTVQDDGPGGFRLRTRVGDTRVSTVRLTSSEPFGDEADADYETMMVREHSPVPGAQEWLEMQWRYHTLEQARAGHEAAVYHVRNHLPLGETLDFWRTSDQVPSHLRQQRCHQLD